ncbi:MAG TPA: DEAD/DEAH box helicase [Oculatellaceae cyanobacterium]
MELRDYQVDILGQLTSATTDDIVQLDTGAGKTPIQAALADWSQYTLLVAHRNILIQQISEKLAAFGLEHDTISTEHTRRMCMLEHKKHGGNYIKRGHKTRLVASMQSIVSAIRYNRLTIDTDLPWLIVIDEAHHAIPDNMWGQLRTLFPNSRIIGFTATPARMDGESLHVDKGGLFNRLVQAKQLEGNSASILIERGYLSPFKVFAARTSYNVAERMTADEIDRKAEHDAKLEAMGEYVDTGQRRVFSNKKDGLDWESGVLELMGDPVEEYKRHSPGKRAILMAPAIKNAELFAKEFRAAGIPAACINSTQSHTEIARLLDAFRTGRCLVLANVDMVGEGFDLPACDTLIIATRTASFPRYRQWCGRVLRVDPSKEFATIIDLTGMCALHGMPDDAVKWDLLNPPRAPQSPRHVPCNDCGLFFKFKLENCPQCGWENSWLRGSDGFSPGSYQFEIRLIDQSYRGFVLRERQTAKNAEIMKTVMQRPYDGFGGDLVGRTLNRLSVWFPEALRDAGISVADINKFIASPDARSRSFWISNFSAKDLNSLEKALKVYKKWLKSQ